MDPIRDLPMGFGMALLQNQRAAQVFDQLPPAQRQELLQKAHAVSSKAEMRALIASLTSQPGTASPQIM